MKTALGMLGAALVFVGAALWVRAGRAERRLLECPSLPAARRLEVESRARSLQSLSLAAAAIGVALMLWNLP